MGVFEIDDPSIDVAALEERVKAAIEAKRGVRFTDEELEELRGAELEPRMRREDLPRGWLDEVAEVRSTVPSRPPSAIAASVVEALYESGSGGLKGGVLRFARRLMRPFYRATLNLDTALWMIIEGLSENPSGPGGAVPCAGEFHCRVGGSQRSAGNRRARGDGAASGGFSSGGVPLAFGAAQSRGLV